MDSLQVPRPSWMSEDLNLLEEQTRKFLAGELVPHLETWHEQGIMDRKAWNKLGEAGLLCAAIPEEYISRSNGYHLNPIQTVRPPLASSRSADLASTF